MGEIVRRGASMQAFPRRAWERENLVTYSKRKKHAMQLTIELPDRLGYRLKSLPNFNEFITKVLAQSIAPPVQEKDIQSDILSKAEQEEYKWLKAAVKNTAFESLSDQDEDIYTLADGKPFHDPEWSKNVVRDFTSITDRELYTSEEKVFAERKGAKTFSSER